MKEAKIIAMTCTHAALKRRDLVNVGFQVLDYAMMGWLETVFVCSLFVTFYKQLLKMINKK